MAVTVTNVTADPNQSAAYGLPWKFSLKDVTFDNAYLTTGEVVTATQVGLSMLVGAWPVSPAMTSTGAAAMPVGVKVNSTGSQATIQAYRYDGASAGKASMEEAANNFDASTYTTRIMFFGH